MRRKRALYILVAVVAVVAIVGGATMTVFRPDGKEDAAYAAGSKSDRKSGAATKVSPTEKAIQAAAKQNRYIFVTFYKKDDAASDKMLAAMKTAQKKVSSKANFARADVDNPVHENLIKRCKVKSAFAPLTLAFAPNGAVTKAFMKNAKTNDVSSAFVSSGMADVLKALQDGKMAVVCLQNGKTKYNEESLAAARGLQADSSLSGSVEIVKIDPSARSESKFLAQCKADASSPNSQIVILVPPGKLVGTFDGATTKDELMADLEKALRSCGSGCGPSGCGP